MTHVYTIYKNRHTKNIHKNLKKKGFIKKDKMKFSIQNTI